MIGPEKKGEPNPLQMHFPIYNEITDLQKVQGARTWMQEELNSLKNRLLTADVACKTEKKKMKEVLEKKKHLTHHLSSSK